MPALTTLARTVLGLALASACVLANAQTYRLVVQLGGSAASLYVPPPPTEYSSVNPTTGSLNFGTLNVGASGQQTVGVLNPGPHTARVLSISTNHAAFSAAHNCPAQLPSGGECQVIVTAQPTAEGSFSGLLHVADSLGSHTVGLLVTGGAPAIGMTGDGDFGTVQLGETSSASFNVTNNGTGSLALTSIAVIGDDAFTHAGGSCSNGTVLAAAASCQVAISASPTAGGVLTGAVQVEGNGQSASRSLTVTVPDPATARAEDLVASPSTLPADGFSTATLTASVRDAAGRALGANQVVNWSSSAGSVSPTSSTTNASGVATTTFTAATAAATASVSAQVGSSSATTTAISMTADAASAHVDSLNADSEIAAGTSQTVTAQVRDVHGNALGAGVTVNWDVTGGTLSAATSTTNAAGVASTQVTAPTSTGSLSVSAYVQPADTPEVANLTVTPDFESRRVVAVQTDTSTLTADGATQAPLQVWSQDQYGNPVPGDTIDIVSSKGALDLTEMTTDASGHAAAMYTVPRILWSIVDGMDSMTVSASSRGTAITVSDNLAVRQVLDVSQFSYDPVTLMLRQNTGVPLAYEDRYVTNQWGQGSRNWLCGSGARCQTWQSGEAGEFHSTVYRFVIFNLPTGQHLSAYGDTVTVGLSPAN